MQLELSKDLLLWVKKQSEDRVATEIIDMLDTWLNGEKKPTLVAIRKVSSATQVPFGYFFLKNPPKEEIKLLEYRTMGSKEHANPSRDLIATVYAMERIQEWAKDKVITDYGEGPGYVGAMKGCFDVDAVAQYMRKVLGLSVDWFAQAKKPVYSVLRYRISQSGTFVMQNGVVGQNNKRPLNIDEFRAFAMVDKYAPLIFINARDSINGRLFSLAHEFCHVCLGSNSLYDLRSYAQDSVSPVEQLCNKVAAEICVPLEIFKKIWSEFHQKEWQEKIGNIAQYFGCSREVIVRRAFDYGILSKSQYEEHCSKVREYVELSGGKGGNYYSTAGSRIDFRLKEMIYSSVLEGKMSYTMAYNMTNTNAKTFERVMLGEEGVL